MTGVATMENQEISDISPTETGGDTELKTRRQTASAWALLVAAAGGPRQWAGKLGRFGRTVALYFNRKEVNRRLRRLQSLGFMETIPTGLQIAFGGLDMVRYFIAPGARSYYETRGINFTFHQVLRFLDDPVSIIDPVGLMSDKDTIIGHILQVTHANPIYDLQILDMFEDGLDDLERQAQQMVDGTHPRQGTIGAIIEDPTYHAKLLDYIRRYRKDPATKHLVRDSGEIQNSRSFVLAEESFSTLPGFMTYAAKLPTSFFGLLKHHRQHKVINPGYCEPKTIARVDALFAA